MSSITFNTNGGAKGGTGSGGSSSITTITITSSTSTVTLTNAGLVGIDAVKIVSIDRAGALYNLVSGAPGIRQCAINNSTGTITVNAAEPFFVGEVVTIKKLV